MPAAVPIAPPRSSRKPSAGHITKKDISEPFGFEHVAHVGLDFNSEDVRNAIKPRQSPAGRTSPQLDNLYESVQRQETPILVPGPVKESGSPPSGFAPEYVSHRNTGVSTASASAPVNQLPPPPAANDITEYENRPSPHIYQNIATKDRPRPSRKKNPPPPPPPQAGKPKLSMEEDIQPSVAFRTQVSVPKAEQLPEEAPRIETPRRIEVAPASVILERPGMLGEMRLGLDDPIPLTLGGASSKYRTPTMLTPKELPVDVPTPLRTPEKKDQSPSKPPLIKEAAVDVPTPSAVSPTTFDLHPMKSRPAPNPPCEPENRPNLPYVPPTAAQGSSALKNVLSELKMKQSHGEEEGTRMEEHEYVSVKEIKRISVEEKKSSPMEKVPEEPPAAKPMPVPKPRKIAATSFDLRIDELPEEEEESAPEKQIEERVPETLPEDPHDDGIDTGCSDEDAEVIRL